MGPHWEPGKFPNTAYRRPKKFPDGLESFQMTWKVSKLHELFHIAWKLSQMACGLSRGSEKFPEGLECFADGLETFAVGLETFQMAWKLSRWTGKFPDGFITYAWATYSRRTRTNDKTFQVAFLPFQKTVAKMNPPSLIEDEFCGLKKTNIGKHIL